MEKCKIIFLAATFFYADGKGEKWENVAENRNDCLWKWRALEVLQ